MAQTCFWLWFNGSLDDIVCRYLTTARPAVHRHYCGGHPPRLKHSSRELEWLVGPVCSLPPKQATPTIYAFVEMGCAPLYGQLRQPTRRTQIGWCDNEPTKAHPRWIGV